MKLYKVLFLKNYLFILDMLVDMKQMSITSKAFVDRGRIPSIYTCDGEDINPPLEFHDIPEDAISLVLIVEDPDSVGKKWTHWVVFNINPHTTVIHEDSVPLDATETVTDFGKMGYGGPCPASGTHRYCFRLFALDISLDTNEDITRDEIDEMLSGHVLEQAELIGLYSRE